MASEGDEKCPRDLTSVEKIFFRNGRNPTWISANISNSYVLNKFSLWFGGFRGPERENRLIRTTPPSHSDQLIEDFHYTTYGIGNKKGSKHDFHEFF